MCGDMCGEGLLRETPEKQGAHLEYVTSIEQPHAKLEQTRLLRIEAAVQNHKPVLE